MFPLRIAGITLASLDQEDTPNPGGNPACFCGNPPKLGLKVSFWEPVRREDVVRKPFCMVSLGGVDIDPGFDAPVASRYRRDGQDQSSFYQVHWYVDPKIGFVFQNFNLLARTTALENVELPLLYRDRLSTARERRERAMAMLARVGLAGREGHRPSQLSGGQEQRVAIARALVTDPAILLADEPTGNLDSRVSEEIMAILQTLNGQGRTVIIITHEADIAQFAGRAVAFRDGRIVSDQPVADRRIARRKESAA